MLAHFIDSKSFQCGYFDDRRSFFEEYLLEDISENEFEFLLSISWRYLIPPQVFEKAEFGAINLHRGDLPKYAGVEPIRKALENNEERIAVCCHHITKNYDEGEVRIGT